MARDLRSSDVKDLDSVTSALGTELVPVERNGRDIYLTAQQIANLGGGGGGAVNSVDGRTGTVTLSDLYDAAGAAASAQAASQPVDADLTAIALLSTTSYGRSLLTLANVATLLANAVVLDPGTSVRNVIEGTAPVTVLTLKAASGLTDAAFKVTESSGHTFLALYDTYDGVSPSQIQQQSYVESDDGLKSVEATFSAQILPDGTQFSSQVGVDAADGSFVDLILSQALAAARVVMPLGQTARALSVEFTSGVNRFRVMPDGLMVSNAHAAPVDGDLNNSDHAIWLDDTPGATALKIKAKDSAGTVRTATIPLG